MRANESLMSAQQAVIAGLSAEGIKVFFDAEGAPYCSVEEREIHLRPFPESVSEAELLQIWADVDHETGHILYTDPDTLTGLSGSKGKLIKMISNGIEDGRIEKLMSDRWYGCGENLRESGKVLLADIKKNPAVPPIPRACCALSCLAYGETEAHAAEKIGDEILPVLSKIRPALEGIESLSSTSEVVEMATKIAEILISSSPEQDEGDEGSEQGEQGEQGQQGEQGGSGKAERSQCGSGRAARGGAAGGGEMEVPGCFLDGMQAPLGARLDVPTASRAGAAQPGGQTDQWAEETEERWSQGQEHAQVVQERRPRRRHLFHRRESQPGTAASGAPGDQF